jgi:hypothetical protein
MGKGRNGRRRKDIKSPGAKARAFLLFSQLI